MTFILKLLIHNLFKNKNCVHILSWAHGLTLLLILLISSDYMIIFPCQWEVHGFQLICYSKLYLGNQTNYIINLGTQKELGENLEFLYLTCTKRKKIGNKKCTQIKMTKLEDFPQTGITILGFWIYYLLLA